MLGGGGSRAVFYPPILHPALFETGLMEYTISTNKTEFFEPDYEQVLSAGF
jgi:hypothetical protein